MRLQVFGLAMLEAIPPVNTGFSTPRQKIILTRDVTFLQKSYGEYSKVEKPVLVTMSYEGPNDEGELDPIINNVNDSNIVTDSDRDTNI